MPVTVRNNSDTIVVLSTLDKTKPHVTWEPRSNPVESIQQCPNDMVESVQFYKAVALGILEVDDSDEALKQAIADQAARYKAGLKASSDATQALIDASTTQRNGTVVITEADLERHIAAVSKSQPSDLSLEPQH